MAQSNAHADREQVTESLRRFGFGEAGIRAMFDMEAQITADKRARARVKPVEAETLFDF